MTDFQKKVYKIVSKIPPGKVMTYGEVAWLAGSPGAGRAVGNALNKNPFSKKQVPCHRVIRADGMVGGYTSSIKKKILLLRAEGITIKNGKVLNYQKILLSIKEVN